MKRVFAPRWFPAIATASIYAFGATMAFLASPDTEDPFLWLVVILGLLYSGSTILVALQGRVEFSDAGIRLAGTGKRYFRKEFVPWSAMTAVTREDMGFGWFLIARMQILIHTKARKYVIMAGSYSRKDLEAMTALLRRVPGSEL